MTSPAAERVSMPGIWLWLLRLGCAAVGCGVGFAVRPVVRWAVSTLSSAPGPLRLAAQIPTPWLAPILTVVGLGAGFWVSEEAKRDSLALTIDGEGLLAVHRDVERYIQRSQVDAVFTDPKELVVLGSDGHEMFRAPATDLSQDALADTLRRHGYPWKGNSDPHEADYHRWVDGHPDVDDRTNALMRARRDALGSDSRAEADNVLGQLQDRGIVVRDRDKTQQYRKLAGQNDDPVA